MATGPTELLKYVNEHVLECSICVEPFKNPKALPCLHVFCRDCIGEYIEKTLKRGRYKCPSCNEEHTLPGEGTESLRDAFLQKSLLEVANLIENKKMACSSCEEGSDAQHACSTCGEFLCADCLLVHKKHKLTKHHEITPISDLQDAQNLADFQKRRYDTCGQHNAEMCKLYCNKDDTPVCHTCTFDPKHKGHDVVTIDAKLQEIKGKVRENRRSLENTVQDLKSKRQTVLKAMADIQEAEKTTLDTISKRVKAIEEMIHTYKSTLTRQIKQVIAAKVNHLQPIHKTLDSEIKRCEKLVHETEILDTLPMHTAIYVAREIIKRVQTKTNIATKTRSDLEETEASALFTKSSLNYDKVEAVLKSVIGFVPCVITNKEPYTIECTDMPDGLKAIAIQAIQEALWETRLLDRHYENYDIMARLCHEKLEKNVEGEWNCYIGCEEQFGVWWYYCYGTWLTLIIDGLHVHVYHNH